MSTEILLKKARTHCPSCGASVDGEIHRRSADRSEEVWLSRSCPDCGESSNRLSSDARFYWLSRGAGSERECCGCSEGGCASAAAGEGIGFLGGNALREVPESNPIEVMSTCLALIEIVDSCNLSCPTCFADSSQGTGSQLSYRPLEDLQERIQGVIERKGPIEILQLSGGEPTLHPQFFELLRWCQENEGIDYVLVNSNGLRLAAEEDFATQLASLVKKGHFQFYLQYDGPEATADLELRGADLRKTKEKAIRRAGEVGIPLTLAMTVIPENLGLLWKTVEFGLQFENVRGVAFQPMFGSGRCDPSAAAEEKINVADLITGLVEQSAGKVSENDFTPLPCGDPNCATIGYLLKAGEEVRSISEYVDFATLQGFLSDRVRYRLEDLIQCGCESEPLGQLLHDLEMDERHTFRLFIKPFMDDRDWDEDRIDRCCTHVIRPDGKLDSFCRYYREGGATAFPG